MLCWALEPRGLFSSCSVHSCSFSPVTSHQLHLFWWLFVAEFLSICCAQPWHTWELRDDIWSRQSGVFSVFLSRFLFRGGWEQRVCSLAVIKRIADSCEILAVFTYCWSLQVTEMEEFKVSGGSPPADRSPVTWRKLWNQRFSATMGVRRRGAQTYWMKKTI